jgi:hypothetical protein
MEEQQKNNEINTVDLRDQLLKSKIEFSQNALKGCIEFLNHDNNIIGSFAEIINTIKDDIKKNPERFYSYKSHSIKNIEDFNDVTGKSFIDDLGEIIKEILLKDKDFILGLIKTIFSL